MKKLLHTFRKNGLFLGCPLGVVLVLIVLCKCLFISFWIIREYETFDFRCSTWNGNGPLDTVYRAKRWALFGSTDPRKFSKNSEDEDEDEDSIRTVVQEAIKKKPLYSRSTSQVTTIDSPKIDARLDFGPLPPNFQRRIDSNHIPEETNDEYDDLPMTTMVTLTNTQIVPLRGDDQGVVKMKTIRNRVEKVGSGEEQFIEIDIENAPRIYVSKIKSRQGEDQDEAHFDLFKDWSKKEDVSQKTSSTSTTKTTAATATKHPKKKGKGLKKAKKLKALKEADAQLSQNLTTSTKKPRKGNKKGKLHKKLKQEEVTKQPRHLVGKSSSAPTTPNPHVSSSSWINGVLDPRDPNFSNKGEIRGYPMQKATRLPVPSIQPKTSPQTTTVSAISEVKTSESSEEKLKISDSTRMMWDMDELKYTTLLGPKTTEQTKFDVKSEDVEKSQAEKFETSTVKENTTEKPLPGGMSKSIWDQKKEEFEAYTPTISKQELQPVTNDPHIFMIPSTSTSSPQPFFPSSFDIPHFPPSETPYYVEVNEADTETYYVKDVTPMHHGVLMRQQEETTTKPYDPLHLEMEIVKLKDSSTCLARLAFDVWCLFVLFSSVPFVMGICVPRWSLFVLHIVFDFLFLVVGFVTSLTIAIMSSIMYFLIDEMTSDTLFEFLLVAFVIDIILILYSIVVGVTYRCCCRLIDNSIKDQSINYSVSNHGEPV
uniref:Uncharacterized protein n=2 Tax=Caenorhabditis japonica TaxID=281687 RepID=A0A8R1HTS4_CAEJA